MTIVAARLSWRGWSSELRRLLQGGPQRPEFQPILRDVRDLVDRIVAEKETDAKAATGRRSGSGRRSAAIFTANGSSSSPTASPTSTSARGRGHRRPSGERARDRARAGHARLLGRLGRPRQRLRRSGHGRRHGRVRVPPGRSPTSSAASGSRTRRRRATTTVSPTRDSGRCATSRTRGPSSAARTGGTTRRSTRSSPRRVCEEVDSDDPIVLVQDYHFALAPRLIRERLPRATIIMFWHIPWPNAERFGICPWREELLEGMLGASILGFHTQLHCNNFLDSVDRFLEARIDREQNAVVQRGRSTLVRPYPISLEWPVRLVEEGAAVADAARASSGSSGWRPTPAWHRRRPPRLHEGHRGAAPRRRAPAGAASGVPRPVHVRPARRAEPHGDPALSAAERKRRGAGRAHQRALRPPTATGPSFCGARITSRRPCSATTGRPMSAT